MIICSRCGMSYFSTSELIYNCPHCLEGGGIISGYSTPPTQTYNGGWRGWRIWRLQNDVLMALTRRFDWQPGKNSTEEIRYAGGFYGLNSLGEVSQQERFAWDCFHTGRWMYVGQWSSNHTAPHVSERVAIGSFIGYGRVKVGTKGMRCEHAVPEYMLTPCNLDYALDLVLVAEKYQMKIISMEQADQLKVGLVPYELPRK